MKSRLPGVPDGGWSEAQASVLDAIRAGPRDNLTGPFLAWIRSPELAQRAQELGAFCRFQTSLPPRLSELAILVTARWWRSQTEWLVHAPIAHEAGVSEEVIAAILADRLPAFAQADEAIVYRVGQAIYADRRVDPELYAEARVILGETTLVELVGVFGYYALVAMTLNVFELIPDDADELPFEEVR